MALSLLQTEAVERLLKHGMRVASLGYPDIIADIKMEGLQYRTDSRTICKRHGLAYHPIPDAHSYFSMKGCQLDVYDVVKERGCEILCDLNHGFTGNLYNVVLDVGTAEHCFNIGKALINMAGMVKEGGWIIHENPSNWGNHGFYNLNPTLFYDFYTDNGFEVEELKLVSRDGRVVQVPPIQRFQFPAGEFNIFCLARRVEAKPFRYPVQSKYKKLIPAAGVSGDTPPVDRAIGEVNG